MQRIGRVTFEHVRREINKDADRLANLAIDEAETGSVPQLSGSSFSYAPTPVRPSPFPAAL